MSQYLQSTDDALREFEKSSREKLPLSSNDRTFPFLITPSSNFKVIPDQIVLESERLSVLVANPGQIRLNLTAGTMQECEKTESNIPKESEIVSNEFVYTFRRRNLIQKFTEPSTEFHLESLHLSSKQIDWNKVPELEKSDIMKLIFNRIRSNIEPDCSVQIGHDVFHCHLIVLQCYSQHFNSLNETKYIELPESSVTSEAFTAIYGWMIFTGLQSLQMLNRENILEVFVAAQYLGIKELEDHCWAFFCSSDLFCEGTAFDMYLKARKIGSKPIVELMVPRIMRFFLLLVSSQDFLELPLEDVCVFLSSNFIAVHSEIEVFMSAVHWLVYDWEKRKEHVLTIMKCIRFGLIAPWQLVDIRRNPENPEFIEITSCASVAHLIEDGLAFAIIKHWYGCETTHYYHWINLLGLKEPHSRNWIGDENTIILYKDFIQDLETYKNPLTLKNVPMRSEQPYVPTQGQNAIIQRHDQLVYPNTKDIEVLQKLSRKKQTECLTLLKSDGDKCTTHELLQLSKSNQNMSESCNIGNQYQDGRKKNSQMKQLQNVPPVGVKCEVSQRSSGQQTVDVHEQPLPITDKADVATITKTLGRQNNSVNYKSYQVKVPVSYPNKEFVPEVSMTRSVGNLNEVINEEFQYSNVQTKQESSNLQSKASLSKDNAQSSSTQRMSFSVLGPSNKNYAAEGSLFFPDKEAVLVFGGVDPHSHYGSPHNTGKDVYRYHPNINTWELVGELPEPRHHHSVAFLRGRVFLVGGADPRDGDVHGRSVVVNTVWSFEPVSCSWSNESDMLTARKNFGLVVSHGRLYAIGGQDKNGRILSSVERFHPTSGTWEEVAPLGVGRMGVAAARYRDFVWVAGGMTEDKKTPLSQVVECYDTKQNIWFPCTPLRFPCCFGRLFASQHTLYLIGGAGRKSERDRTTSSLGTIDVWDYTVKEWHMLAEMAVPRHGHSIAYIGTQVLIIGGVTTVYMRALKNVECFCCERGTWIRGVSNLPITLSGHGSVTLPPALLM